MEGVALCSSETDTLNTDLPFQHTIRLSKLPSLGAWVAHLVKGPTSVQVMLSRFVSSSPALGSVLLTAWSLELLWILSLSLSLSLSAPSPPTLCLPLSLNNKYTLKKIKSQYFIIVKTFLKIGLSGAPGWLSRLSGRLRLRS